MIDGVSSTEQTQAVSQLQDNLAAVRNEAQSQQQLATAIADQTDRQAQQVDSRSNPEGVGTAVDTYA
jgi:hypothetical protein